MNPKDSVGAKKAPLRYVPPALMLEVSRIMENGANKYGPYNWREQPVSAVTYVEAAMRHLFAWLDRQDNAEDSGLPHLAHAAASLGILLDAIAGGNMLDDRFTAGPAADILRRLDQSTSVPTTPDGDVDWREVVRPRQPAEVAKLLEPYCEECGHLKPEHALTCGRFHEPAE